MTGPGLLIGVGLGMALSGLAVLVPHWVDGLRRARTRRTCARFSDWQSALDRRARLQQIRQTPWAPRPALN